MAYAMELKPLALPGCFHVTASEFDDDRGSFRHILTVEALRAQKLPEVFAQCALSRNRERGTLRGLHYQAAPMPDAKLVSCIRGTTYEILADMREGPSFGQTVGVEIAADRYEAVFVAEGVAHGFQTLEDDTELLYLITAPYQRELARGVLWHDPRLGIQLPLPISKISDQDRTWPRLGG